ncbi:NAD(P)H-binding protein [Roseivirga pacifica]|uniref:NAD(P)H-binding protein n=1 Tax=Roseivirga pacifica TaxID=1267423 RepID=UPI00227A4690|nr:NAD(P)H-binding protein [Roseivirga pacifica]
MKEKVLVIGANGAIASHVIDFIQQDETLEISLLARNESQIAHRKQANTEIIVADVLNPSQLNKAIQGQDVVYANLAGQVDEMAMQIVQSMTANGVKRLIFVTSLGIYNEIPGLFGVFNKIAIGQPLKRYRRAADIIESSDLDYTIVRPAWLTNKDEVNYETTKKGEPFKGMRVSRKSVGAFIADLIVHPEKEIKQSIGVNRP